MGAEFKIIIGSLTEFFLTALVAVYIVSVFWNGGGMSDIPAVIWGMAVSLLGKYGFQKGSEVITTIKGKPTL